MACSLKTISRMITQKKIQRQTRRVPGRKPMVFNADAIEALRAETVQLQPRPRL